MFESLKLFDFFRAIRLIRIIRVIRNVQITRVIGIIEVIRIKEECLVNYFVIQFSVAKGQNYIHHAFT